MLDQKSVTGVHWRVNGDRQITYSFPFFLSWIIFFCNGIYKPESPVFRELGNTYFDLQRHGNVLCYKVLQPQIQQGSFLLTK